MSFTMLYLPQPEDRASRPLPRWHARIVAKISHPIMLLIIALCCLWLWLWPGKRLQFRALRARAPVDCSFFICLHVLAGFVLERWPYFVTVILGVGGIIGLVLMDFSGVWWGLGSAVIGASLAPALADVVPPHFFQRSRNKP